jgi:hypothetical protein
MINSFLVAYRWSAAVTAMAGFQISDACTWDMDMI